jgi:hypothetical protein
MLQVWLASIFELDGLLRDCLRRVAAPPKMFSPCLPGTGPPGQGAHSVKAVAVLQVQLVQTYD